jgi:curved DNA-binding protein
MGGQRTPTRNKEGDFDADTSRKVRVNSPKGTPNGRELRLRGLGMPLYARKNEFGTLLAKVEIRMPDHLSEQEFDLFGKLAALRGGK